MPKTNETRLRAVLFTDVVSSTELAREMGDVRWSRLLEAQRRVIRRLLRSMGGREVDTAGDGFFAVFDRTADAVRCAFAACREVQELGLDIRAGVHVGEVELAGHEVHGIVVHTGARVMGQAGASEVLVTATVKDLVAGARFDLRERGTVELKGVPGTWTLYDVMAVDEQLRPAPIEQASVASERRDRVASSPARGRAGPALDHPGRGRRGRASRRSPRTRSRDPNPPPFRRPAPWRGSTTPGGSTSRSRSPRCPPGSRGGRGGSGSPISAARSTGSTPETGESGSRGAAGVPTGVAVGDGAVWVTNGFGVGDGPDGGVSRIDPVGESLEPAFATPDGLGGDRVGSGPRLGDRHGDRRGAGLRPRHARVRDRRRCPPDRAIRPAPSRSSSARGATSSGWAMPRRAASSAWTPRRRRSIDTFTVTTPVTGLAVSEDGVWVTGGADDRITLLDAETGAVVTSLDVAGSRCNQPEGVAVGADAVWVACSASRTLLRIDPGTRTAAGSLALDGAPAALTTDADGSVWVAVRPA